MWGFVAIPEGERWSLCSPRGELRTLVGPTVVRVFGARLLHLTQKCAAHGEYLWVQFVDGRTEIVPGPAVVHVDTTIHKDVKVHKAMNLTDHEVLVVYREEENEEDSVAAASVPVAGDGAEKNKAEVLKKETKKEVVRSLVHGPRLHIPKNASEWIHDFAWHGSVGNDAEGMARKFKSALKFKKLRTCPDQTYYDVEGVRTQDDALLTVKLMIFYRLRDIDMMLRETHDPVADFVNAVSSDVIEFVAGKTFQEFKEATDQLNELRVYQQLTSRAKGIGYDVTKVVFRGYGAPTRLQKMHDDAIERRTKLALERETETQEQQLLDMKLDREEERNRKKRTMETDAKAHQRELERMAHEAEQAQKRAERQAHLQHLAQLQRDVGLSAEQVAAYIIAVENGPPEKLIQINGKEACGNGFVHLQEK